MNSSEHSTFCSYLQLCEMGVKYQQVRKVTFHTYWALASMSAQYERQRNIKPTGIKRIDAEVIIKLAVILA